LPAVDWTLPLEARDDPRRHEHSPDNTPLIGHLDDVPGRQPYEAFELQAIGQFRDEAQASSDSNAARGTST
jgi:hypothetical protein